MIPLERWTLSTLLCVLASCTSSQPQNNPLDASQNPNATVLNMPTAVLSNSALQVSGKSFEINGASNINSSHSYTSSKGLCYNIPANSSTSATTQRIEYYMHKNRSMQLPLQVAWTMQLSAPSVTNWAVLYQLRQDGNSGSPIVALELKPGSTPSTPNLSLVVRNTSYYNVNNTSPAAGSKKELWSHTPDLSVPHQVALYVLPNSSGNTASKLWFRFDQHIVEYSGDIGFPENFLGQTIYKQYTAHQGLYRASVVPALEHCVLNYAYLL